MPSPVSVGSNDAPFTLARWAAIPMVLPRRPTGWAPCPASHMELLGGLGGCRAPAPSCWPQPLAEGHGTGDSCWALGRGLVSHSLSRTPKPAGRRLLCSWVSSCMELGKDQPNLGEGRTDSTWGSTEQVWFLGALVRNRIIPHLNFCGLETPPPVAFQQLICVLPPYRGVRQWERGMVQAGTSLSLPLPA